MHCWDDEGVDVNQTLTRIIRGVFHHPALRHLGDDGASEGRKQMYGVVEEWWRSKSESEKRALREQLSRTGVEHGKNHKEGVHDSGHGGGRATRVPKNQGPSRTGAGRSPAPRYGQPSQSDQVAAGVGKLAGSAVGGGVLGGVVGGLVSGVGASLLDDALKGGDERKGYAKERYGDDGSHTQSRIEAGHHKKKQADDDDYYVQAEHSRTSFPSGGSREEYRRYEQPGIGSEREGYGYERTHTTRQRHEGGYEETVETRRLRPGGEWETEERSERVIRSEDRYQSEDRYVCEPSLSFCSC